MTGALKIRPATVADAASLLAIYRPFVESTAVSFETAAPTTDEFAARIAKALAGWQWLLAERALVLWARIKMEPNIIDTSR